MQTPQNTITAIGLIGVTEDYAFLIIVGNAGLEFTHMGILGAARQVKIDNRYLGKDSQHNDGGDEVPD